MRDMATQPLGGSASAFPAISPMPAVARILARFERDQLAGFIAVALDLIDMLDDAEGDPEGYEGDTEDAFALSGQALRYHTGPGCPISDTGEDDDIETGIEDDPRGCDPETDYGGEELGECEQMVNDVPTVPCFAIEPGDDGKRAFVGFWNPGSFVGDQGPGVLIARAYSSRPLNR